jgi:hypothetical protein
MVRSKAFAAVIGFFEAVLLDHGTHGTVQNQNALFNLIE